MNITQFKSHFFHSNQRCNLNNAGQALIPDVNKQTALLWLERFYQEGAWCAPEGWAQTEIVRGKLAQFLGAYKEEIAFFQTTASALSQAAFSIPLQKEDEILTWDQEYPSNFYPWRLAAESKGAKVIQVESEKWETPVEKLLQRVTSKTKVVAISWVQYQTGAVTDLAFLADSLKEKNIWLVADVIQGVGVRPFDFHHSGFDIVCGGSHKWLCSSYGSSYMAIKKSRLEQLKPLEVGAMTFGDPDTKKSFDNQPKPTAHRFEPGSKSMIEVIAMGATLDLLLSIGIDNIYLEARRLTNRLKEGLQHTGYSVIGGDGSILNMIVPDANELKRIDQKLLTAKIAHAKRGPGIRFSPHAYNTDEEIDYLIQNLNK